MLPTIIRTTFEGSPPFLLWYEWGVLAGLFITLAGTFWIFVDAHRRDIDATAWKSLAAVACVLNVPALLARLNGQFALDVRASLPLVAVLSMVGVLLAVVAVIAHAFAKDPARRCEVCGQPMDSTWTSCPRHAAPLQPLSGGVGVGGWSAQAPIPSQVGFSSPGQSDATLTEFPGPFSSNNGGISSTMNNESLPAIGLPTIGNVGASGGAGAQTQIFGGSGGVSSPPGGVPGGTMVISTKKVEDRPLAFLFYEDGPNRSWRGKDFRLNVDRTRVGRAAGNDISLNDQAVSTNHFVIRHEKGTYTLQDAASTNGTLVNGGRVAEHVLHDNDLIEVGETRLRFRSLAGGSSAAQLAAATEA